tara:strand:- start:2318 stop:3271 length:954 start_codon:yes stop_codon:yes gene_type:complete
METDFISHDKLVLLNKTKQFIYVKKLKHTLKKLGLSIEGKKPQLVDRLNVFYKNIGNYDQYTKDIIKIQKYYRNYLKTKNGPGFSNKSLCINDEDFYTFETKEEIDPLYFFSIMDDNGKIFFFDIRSLEKLLISNRKMNPYTTEIISESNISKIYKRLSNVKKDSKYKSFPKQKLSDEQIYNNQVLNIFQKIDMLDVAAGGANTTWFNDLSIKQLKQFYKGLEDIWNYRAELTEAQKQAIVPNKNMFSFSVSYIINLPENNKTKTFIRKVLLNEIEMLIDSSSNIENKKTGAYFVLTCLTDVSEDCRNSLPWLVQYT